jgi:5-methyltetrahydrofolate--homocysteine methyltransferase
MFAIGLNCALGTKQMSQYIEDMSRISDYYCCCYPNAGNYYYYKKKDYQINLENMTKQQKKWRKK